MVGVLAAWRRLVKACFFKLRSRLSDAKSTSGVVVHNSVKSADAISPKSRVPKKLRWRLASLYWPTLYNRLSFDCYTHARLRLEFRT